MRLVIGAIIFVACASVLNGAYAQLGDLTILSSSDYVDTIDNLNVVGEVQNNSPTVAEFVQITGTFYDTNGQVVGTEFTFTQPSSIGPGAKAPFHLILGQASIPVRQITNYSLTASHS